MFVLAVSCLSLFRLYQHLPSFPAHFSVSTWVKCLPVRINSSYYSGRVSVGPTSWFSVSLQTAGVLFRSSCITVLVNVILQKRRNQDKVLVGEFAEVIFYSKTGAPSCTTHAISCVSDISRRNCCGHIKYYCCFGQGWSFTGSYKLITGILRHPQFKFILLVFISCC